MNIEAYDAESLRKLVRLLEYENRLLKEKLKKEKTGFSIWTGDVHSKQIVNAIYDSGNYTEKFEQDIVEAEKMIVISSPDIRQNKIDRLLLLVKGRQEKGVKVTVITTDPEEVVYSNADVCYELIREMRQVGINVVTKAEVEERFAVIDDELVWHGGMNLLGKVDVWDNLMRIKSHQVAAELLKLHLELYRNHKEVLMKKQLKCYIYTRVSTSMQVDGYSLDAQKDKLHKCELPVRSITQSVNN